MTISDKVIDVTESCDSQLLLIAEARDPDAPGHNRRVRNYSRFVARILGLGKVKSESICDAAATHDIGKLGIPNFILFKPGPLTAEEWVIMKRHARIGANLLRSNLASEVAMTHHERWDGTGYPLGLSQDRIPIASRIVALCDQYDALRTARPYKAAYSHDEAYDVIVKGDERTRPEHFDPEILALFQCFHREFETIYNRDQTPPGNA